MFTNPSRKIVMYSRLMSNFIDVKFIGFVILLNQWDVLLSQIKEYENGNWAKQHLRGLNVLYLRYLYQKTFQIILHL